MSNLTRQQRILGALFASVAGDALGVPVEFQSRRAIQQNPVTGMRGFGTHCQPAGTWSDDSSMMVCTVVSLLERNGYEPQDLADRFVRWAADGYWGAHGKVFDIGNTTAQALDNIASGCKPEEGGREDEYSNGNGSLMRILPMALWFADHESSQILDAMHRASGITHRHPRAQMGCGFFSLIVRELLLGAPPTAAYERAIIAFREHYVAAPFLDQRLYFQAIEGGMLASTAENEIDSGGYVLATLSASLWCLLNTTTLSDAVLKAVNLGFDTDTTGCVTGTLAGLVYGIDSIPGEWIEALARRAELEELFKQFAIRLE